jgi:hypothetical protein
MVLLKGIAFLSLASLAACEDARPSVVIYNAENAESQSNSLPASSEKTNGNVAASEKTEQPLPEKIKDAPVSEGESQLTMPPPNTLQGTWVSNCHSQPELGFVIFRNIYTSTRITAFTSFYEDAACTTLIGTGYNEMVYTISGPSTVVPGATNYDATLLNPDGNVVIYSIFKYEGDKLIVGTSDAQGNTGLTPATRFRSLSTLFTYTQVK